MSILRARELRKTATDTEQVLWYNLRNRNLLNYRFKRQVKIDNYIVDFLCPEKKLIIELDGGQHVRQMIYDDKRTDCLHRKGFKVLRFWNNDIIEQLEVVLERIIQELNSS